MKTSILIAFVLTTVYDCYLSKSIDHELTSQMVLLDAITIHHGDEIVIYNQKLQKVIKKDQYSRSYSSYPTVAKQNQSDLLSQWMFQSFTVAQTFQILKVNTRVDDIIRDKDIVMLCIDQSKCLSCYTSCNYESRKHQYQDAKYFQISLIDEADCSDDGDEDDDDDDDDDYEQTSTARAFKELVSFQLLSRDPGARRDYSRPVFTDHLNNPELLLHDRGDKGLFFDEWQVYVVNKPFSIYHSNKTSIARVSNSATTSIALNNLVSEQKISGLETQNSTLKMMIGVIVVLFASSIGAFIFGLTKIKSKISNVESESESYNSTIAKKVHVDSSSSSSSSMSSRKNASQHDAHRITQIQMHPFEPRSSRARSEIHVRQTDNHKQLSDQNTVRIPGVDYATHTMSTQEGNIKPSFFVTKGTYVS